MATEALASEKVLDPIKDSLTRPKAKDEQPTTEPAKDQTSSDKPADTDSKSPKQLTIKQLKEYPKEVRTLNLPDPTTEGQMQVGVGRRKPFWLSYKLYGSGPINILWLCGHGDTLKAWRRHVQHFGFENSETYTSLLVDSRGVGDSEAPFGWWSMKDLAKDMIELLDKIEWVAPRSVHIVGHSMGGMMAQEMVCFRPIAALWVYANKRAGFGDT
jgi:hypothetical protein